MQLIRTDTPGFVKDSLSGALINIDDVQYNMFKQTRQKALDAMTLTAELESVKNEMSEIKNLLAEVLRERQGK